MLGITVCHTVYDKLIYVLFKGKHYVLFKGKQIRQINHHEHVKKE